VVLFEKHDRPGGLMRTNIPSFRLPETVLQEECDAILDMGVQVRYNSEVTSMKALLAETFDAVFVGSGAPRGKDLELPGRAEAAANIHIGIDWLESIAFKHVEKIGERVLIIGVGNTAMDCCRSSRRMGGKDIKVMARRPRGFFKASPWELEDAEEEGVEILVNHAPKRFVLEKGKLVGMEFERLEWDADARKSKTIDSIILPCDDVILAIGQEAAFPWIERDLGIEFGEWEMPTVNETTFMSTRSGVFFGGDAGWGPKNIIWAVAHGHEAAISIHQYLQGEPLDQRPPRGVNLTSQKMGMSEWSYSNDFNPVHRQKMKHVDLAKRFKELSVEVELGFTPEQAAREVERCLNCDIQTVFDAPRCIECDACVDVCPVLCLTIAPNGEPNDVQSRLTTPAVNPDQALFVSEDLPQTHRVMLKDENICVHCGLCAERCPTAAWDMQKSVVLLPYAGTGPCLQARQRQRHRFGFRERALDAGDLPHGDSGLRQEPVPVQHPGTSHLVRDPGEQGRKDVAGPGLRPDRRDERTDVRSRREGGPPRRLPAVRLHLAPRRGPPA
jgi:NADPH-dependent glutamate synthase beta subunit-like oxidoreductase